MDMIQGTVPHHQLSRMNVNACLRSTGSVVVLNEKLVKTPRHLVDTVKTVARFGLVAEATCRIGSEILREAMPDLLSFRDEQAVEGNWVVLGLGSIMSDRRLQMAQELGFDMLVGPANMVSGDTNDMTALRIAQENEFFIVPGVMTPAEFQRFLTSKTFRPDAIKFFNSDVLKAAGLKGILGPFQDVDGEGWRDTIIMPTGGVKPDTFVDFVDAIAGNGFCPVLGMSSWLDEVPKDALGNADAISLSIIACARKVQAKLGEKEFGIISRIAAEAAK